MSAENGRRRQPFVSIRPWVLFEVADAHGLNLAERRLLVDLLLLADYRTGMWPRLTGSRQAPPPKPGSLDVLAAEVGCSRATLHPALKRLQEAKVIAHKAVLSRGVIVAVVVYPFVVELGPGDAGEHATSALTAALDGFARLAPPRPLGAKRRSKWSVSCETDS